MPNRISNLNAFANLNPPWLLSSLDQNSNFITTAFNDSSLGYANGIASDFGGPNNYSIVIPYGSPSGYNPGMLVGFIPSSTNTGPSQLTIYPLGAVQILNAAGLTLNGGELSLGQAVWMMYNSGSPVGFRLISPCGFYRSVFSQSSNQNFAVNGYSAVELQVQYSSGVNLVTSLTGLSCGVSVSISVINATGAATAFGIYMQNTSSVQMNIIGLQSGSTGGGGFLNLNNGVIINNNSAMCFQGVSGTDTIILSH